MMDKSKNTCNICKIKAYIACDQCEAQVFFCSRGHLHSHKIKYHKFNRSDSNFSTLTNEKEEKSNYISKTPNKYEKIEDDQLDLRKLFEHLQNLKSSIESKLKNKEYLEAILSINKCIALSKRFYKDDDLFILEMQYKLAESNININNLEEAIYHLENLLNTTSYNKITSSIKTLRYKAYSLIGASCMNISDYNKALKVYNSCEAEVTETFQEPELNLKLTGINLNLGICYVYLNNFNIAEKYFKKGLTQTEGLLGNDIIYKLNADLYENLGIVQENYNKPKDALNYFKKALKTKFNMNGENDDEVLDLQYKISSVYISQKQFKEAEEIMSAMTDVIIKEKLKENNLDCFYRYGVYFYTLGMVLLKTNKYSHAKAALIKAETLWKDILNPNDPVKSSLSAMLKISDKKN